MILLNPKQYSIVTDLFRDLDIHLAVPAIINGKIPGTIYVDDLTQPRTAVLEAAHKFYLAGFLDRSQSIQKLRALFQEQVVPQAQAAGTVAFKLIFPEGWEDCIEHEILDGLYPIPNPYEYYEFRLGVHRLRENWRSRIPEGFQLACIDQALVDNTRLKNLEALLEKLRSKRGSVQAFLEHGFGYVLIHESRLASWCLSEYDWGDCCEVNIATEEAYRRRGLATIAGAAMVERALERNIRRIGWGCRKNNLPSAATARRLGFEKVCDHPAYEMFCDPGLNLAVHGGIELYQEHFSAALSWYEQAFVYGAPDWAYLGAASAAARVGEMAKAVALLNEAFERGFRDWERLLKNEHLQGLHDLPEWKQLIDRIVSVSQ